MDIKPKLCILLHNYEDLFFYFFAQIFAHICVFMCNYYVINILPTMDFTHSQTIPKPLKINISILFHNFVL
jgi:hypothetical protein